MIKVHASQRVTAMLLGVIAAATIGVFLVAPRPALAEGVDSSTGEPRLMAAPDTAERPVHASAPGSLVSLTFDDGPSPELTPRILDILREKGVKAAFFLQGRWVKKYPELVKRIQAEGHVIGNHSWSHPNFEKISARQARNEILRTNDVIERITGERPVLFRYPYGRETEAGNKVIRAEGMWGGILWHWDSQPGDYTCPGKEGVQRYVVENAVDQGLILLHDGNDVVQCGTEQLDYLAPTIDELRSKGFEFGIPVPADGPSEVNQYSWIKVVPSS